jgi:hypothetical protein
MSKYLYLQSLFIAAAIVFVSCKSSSPNEAQTSPQMLSNYKIEVSGIPVILATRKEEHSYGASTDTTYYVNSLFEIRYGSPDTIKLCKQIQYGDTVRFCDSYTFDPPDPTALDSWAGGGSTIEYALNTSTSTIRYLSFSNGTDSYAHYFDQGGSHRDELSVGEKFVALNIPFTRHQDTIVTFVHGTSITFQDKSVDQYNLSHVGGDIIGHSTNTDIDSIQNPLPDSAYIKLTLVLRP